MAGAEVPPEYPRFARQRCHAAPWLDAFIGGRTGQGPPMPSEKVVGSSHRTLDANAAAAGRAVSGLAK